MCYMITVRNIGDTFNYYLYTDGKVRYLLGGGGPRGYLWKRNREHGTKFGTRLLARIFITRHEVSADFLRIIPVV